MTLLFYRAQNKNRFTALQHCIQVPNQKDSIPSQAPFVMILSGIGKYFYYFRCLGEAPAERAARWVDGELAALWAH